MNQFLSDKLRVMSFVSIILVLYIHSGFHQIPNEIEGMVFNQQLQYVIRTFLGRLAVPLFFMISGYLFFLHCDDRSALITKMVKRSRTLLVPYIIGCLYAPLFFVVMEQFPFTAKFANGHDVTGSLLSLSPVELFRTLFIARAGDYAPFAYQLWFLRDLIVIIAFTPIIYIVRKRIRGGYLYPIMVFLIGVLSIKVQIIASLFWFLMGDWLLPYLSNRRFALTPFAYIAICVCQFFTREWEGWTYLNLPTELVGVFAIWQVYDLIVSQSFTLSNHEIMTQATNYTFFIYLFHVPTLNIVRKLIVFVVGNSSFGFATSYILSPWVFALIFIGIGITFKRWLPRTYSFCTGGR